MKYAVHAVILILLFAAQVSWADFKVLVIDTGLSSKRPELTKYVLDKYKDKNFEDTHGHGTHVTSIILEKACPGVKIIPCNFYRTSEDEEDLTEKRIIKCLAVGLKEKVDLVNMSLYGSKKDEKEAAILKAYEILEIPVHVALGNNENKFEEGEGTFPADLDYKNIIKIGSLDEGVFAKHTNIRHRSVYVKSDFLGAGLEANQMVKMKGTSQATAYYSSLKVEEYCKKEQYNSPSKK